MAACTAVMQCPAVAPATNISAGARQPLSPRTGRHWLRPLATPGLRPYPRSPAPGRPFWQPPASHTLKFFLQDRQPGEAHCSKGGGAGRQGGCGGDPRAQRRGAVRSRAVAGEHRQLHQRGNADCRSSMGLDYMSAPSACLLGATQVQAVRPAAHPLARSGGGVQTIAATNRIAVLVILQHSRRSTAWQAGGFGGSGSCKARAAQTNALLGGCPGAVWAESKPVHMRCQVC